MPTIKQNRASYTEAYLTFKRYIIDFVIRRNGHLVG